MQFRSRRFWPRSICEEAGRGARRNARGVSRKVRGGKRNVDRESEIGNNRHEGTKTQKI